MAEGYSGNNKCGICLSEYSDPRLIDCFHIFCSPCLAKLAKKDFDGDTSEEEEGKDEVHVDSVVCPLCRVKTIIPADGINGLQTYPFQSTSKTIENDAEYCQWCDEENLAEHKCLDCQEFLCRGCREYHQKLKKFKHHKLEATNFKTKPTVFYKTDCPVHKKENSLFCKPCNAFLCSDCSESNHNMHKTRPLIQEAALQRNIIGAGIGALNSRVEVVNQVLEKAKSSREEYCRANTRTKSEMTSYLKNLKVIICNTIDTVLDSNVCQLADFEKKDLKVIETFIDETERDKMSLSYMIKTAEDLIHFASDEETIKLSNGLCSQIRSLINNFCGTMPQLYPPQYIVSDYKYDEIHHKCGKIERSETLLRGEVVSPKYNIIFLPMLLKMQNLTIVSEFAVCNDLFLDICKDQREGVWVISKSIVEENKKLTHYTLEGKQTTHLHLDDDLTQILKHTGETIYFRSYSTIKEVIIPFESTDEQLFTYTGGNIGICCALDTGSFLFYDKENCEFKEIDKDKNVKTKIICDEPLESIMRFIQLENGTVIFSSNVGLFKVDIDGHVEKMDLKSNALRGICKDKYGNIFVANFGDSEIYLVDKHFRYHEVVLSSTNGIYKPVHITIDNSGNLWIKESRGGCKIFSYL